MGQAFFSSGQRHFKAGCRLAVLALATELSACALMTGAAPSVEVLRVRLVGIGLTEQQLETTLYVTNPSTTAIGFRQVAVDLDVSGLPLVAGRSDVPSACRPPRQPPSRSPW